MNSGRIRVLHVIWSGGSGGAERFLLDITRHCDHSRFEHVVCFLSKGGWVADEMVRSGVEVYVLGMTNGWSVHGALRLLMILRKIRPDLVHNHVLNYCANIILLFFSKVPRLYFEHGGAFLAPNPAKEVLFYRLFGMFHDRILPNSEYVRDRILLLTKADPRKVEVYYIGIDPHRHQSTPDKDLRRSLGIPDPHKVVGIIGRLVKMKGVDDFIRIAAQINKQQRSCGVSFVVVGGGELQASFEGLSKELGVEIRFMGDRADAPALLRLFDVFLFTSKWEPFGIVILEAMASGVPVVGFKTGGADEIMVRGGAIMVENRDVVKAAEAVVDLLEHPERSRALGDEGRRNVFENFEVRSSVTRLERIYLSIRETGA